MKPLLFILFAAGLVALERPIIFAETFTEGVRVSPKTVTLKPGEYVWEPERAPEGPLLIVASITEQVAYVYRNGIRIARSSVSTGRPGHRTPTGVFTILEKEVHHTSSIYKGAEMPYMERVTWGGIALHAGDLPGYPDSHGCVRLPLEFSKLLFGVTMKGATVIIADEHSAPTETVHPGLFFAQSGQQSEPEGAGKFDWDPDKSPSGPVSVIVSSADKTVYVYRNGMEIGRGRHSECPGCFASERSGFQRAERSRYGRTPALGGSDLSRKRRIKPGYVFNGTEERASDRIPS
jgi:hypothetical protein